MGQKGSKLTQEATDFCQQVLQGLAEIRGVRSKKMFGGYGLFKDDVMFALITSNAELYFRVTDANQARFEEVNARKYGRMPYFSAPDSTLEDQKSLCEWASTSIAAAQEAQRH